MKGSEIIDIAKWKVGKLLPKNWGKKWLLLFFIGCWAIVFRAPILQGIGNFLIKEDPLKKSDAIFVLGGNIFDRSTHGVYLYEQGYASTIHPMGEVVEKILLTTDDKKPDAVLSQYYMVNELNTPAQDVKPIIKGTSTKEEAEAILSYAIEHKYQRIIVVSDKFHLRRISTTFKAPFEEKGIEVLLSGAPNSSYREDYWWKYEAGLIMVNNEYVKLLYYLVKY
ncbi:MAG: YdcF family protein [Flavobacteriales bacterium]|jgi:uncharacterized SAM-binding protein YcdF (DUF218 family)|nr:YdcF family protein [Flavobacteriales bacterium]